eukprot:3001-Heterococcus_DN1.PRE.1
MRHTAAVYIYTQLCDATRRKQLTPRCLGLLSEFQSYKQLTLLAFMIAPALMQYISIAQEPSL